MHVFSLFVFDVLNYIISDTVIITFMCLFLGNSMCMWEVLIDSSRKQFGNICLFVSTKRFLHNFSNHFFWCQYLLSFLKHLEMGTRDYCWMKIDSSLCTSCLFYSGCWKCTHRNNSKNLKLKKLWPLNNIKDCSDFH